MGHDMKKRRSLDYDGLDGVLDATKTAKSKSGWQPSYGLAALVLVGAVGAYMSLSPVQLPTEIGTAVQTVSADKLKAEIPQPPETQPSPAPVSPPSEPTAAAEPEPATSELVVNPGLQAEQPTPIAAQESHPAAPTVPVPADPAPATEQAATVAADQPPPAVTVYFKLDSSKPNLSDKNQLAAVLETAKRCPDLIQLTGHTCNLGTAEFNKALGLTRAAKVKKLLISHGVAEEKILISSEGMAKPAAINATSKGQAINRRVELICQSP
jgi:outer membrane protein OmpA-like peptidoglycan-associated protein